MSETIEEVIDAVVVGAKGKLFLFRHREEGPIHRKNVNRFVDKLLDFFKGKADGAVGEVVDLGKGRD